MSFDSGAPVVILRCARQGGLGITRSLGRLGVRVLNVDSGPLVPAFVSRYSSGHFEWNFEAATEEQSIEFLQSLSIRVGQRPLLIPTSDPLAMFVADHAARLEPYYLFSKPGALLVRSLCSKRELHFLARRLGIPTPETAFPQNRRDAEAYLSSARFPVMLKGIHGNKMGSKSGKRMFIVRSPEEFLRVYDAHETPGTPNLMIQEFIPGDHESDWMFNGYANSAGQCLMGITGVKLRQYPAYTGLTSLGICLQNAEVQRWAATFMERTGYSGILDMDFRYDARDGEYKLLDANPRVGATFRLFVGENGMDVVRAQYLDLTGQAVPAVKSREGRKWMVEDCDLLSCLRYFRDGKLTASDWLKSHRGIQETAIFALDDPLPALWMGLRDVWTFWRRRMGGPKAEML